MSGSHAIIVVDLAFGDCGKGSIVDFLARQTGAHAVVRFNGGPQAAHNVMTSDGRHHTFSQFGSATFVPGVRTLLSRFMLIEPYALFNEAAHLRQVGVSDAMGRLTIDRRCVIITPAHQAANRLREIARGHLAHGTCGMGIGEAVQDAIDCPDLILRAADLTDRNKVRRLLRQTRDLKLEQLRDVIAPTQSDLRAQFSRDTLLDCCWIEAAVENYAELAKSTSIADETAVHKMLNAPRTVIYEGAQGILLDESFGFHPHTTWSKTTFANALALTDEAKFAGPRTRVGVLRTYFTRHGPGPFVTEDDDLRCLLKEPHNDDAGWQGRFRVGPFDAVAARYATEIAGSVDFLAMTHLDQLHQLPAKICTAYEYESDIREPTRPGEFFIQKGNKISRIRRKYPADAAHQSVLTALLPRCVPVYRELTGRSSRAFLDAIREELEVRIGITSSGPIAVDKQIIDPNCLATN